MIVRGLYYYERLQTLAVTLQKIAALGGLPPPPFLIELLARWTAWNRRKIVRSCTTSTNLLTKAFVEIAQAGGVASINCLDLFGDVAEAVGSDRWSLKKLARLCIILSVHADVEIRNRFVRSFPHVLPKLAAGGSKPLAYLFVALHNLLRDSDENVRTVTLLNVRNILCGLLLKSRKSHMPAVKTICCIIYYALRECRNETVAEIALIQMAEMMEKNPQKMKLQGMSNNLSMLYLQSGSDVVRKRAALLKFQLSLLIESPQQREKHVRGFLYMMSKISSDQSAFILECAEAALLTYSQETFVATFPCFVLDQAKNPDPCVRVRLAKMIPRLAPWCQGLRSFRAALELLRNDSDELVKSAIMLYIRSDCAANCQAENNNSKPERSIFQIRTSILLRRAAKAVFVDGLHIRTRLRFMLYRLVNFGASLQSEGEGGEMQVARK